MSALRIGRATIGTWMLCFLLGNQIPRPVPIIVILCLVPVATLAGIGANYIDGGRSR